MGHAPSGFLIRALPLEGLPSVGGSETKVGPMQFGILGPVEADGPNGPVPLGGPRHRVVLATLLTSPGSAVSVDRLAEALWGDGPPRQAVEMLHVRISELRRFLHAEPDIIVTRRPGYLLDVASEQVDAQRFESAVAEARRALNDGDAAVAVTRLDAALAMWRGSALPEIADRSFAQPYGHGWRTCTPRRSRTGSPPGSPSVSIATLWPSWRHSCGSIPCTSATATC